MQPSCRPDFQVYIKKNKLNAGRTIKPDAKLKTVFPVARFALVHWACES